MPNRSEEPDDDDSAEIQSSLTHEFKREPGKGSVVATITESRGLRHTQWSQFDCPDIDDPAEFDPAHTHALLFMAANRHLRAVGEMDYFAVLDTSEELTKAEYPSPEQISRHLRMWIASLKTRKGSLSVDTIAARFLQSQDRLLQLLSESKEMQEAAMAYADAWHWLHMELYGEHELAANAEAAERTADAAQQYAAKASAGRAEGPKAQKMKGALRLAVIATEYEKYAAKEDKLARRLSAKHVASHLHERINDVLAKDGLGSVTIATLEKRLTTLIKDAGRRR